MTRMAYAGAAVHDGQMAYAYFNLDPRGAALGSAELYREPLCEAEVGQVIEVPTRTNGGIPKGAARVVGTHVDPEEVTEWRVRHDATMGVEQAWQRPMANTLERLAPIREAYQRLDPEAQGVLIAQVVRYIVHGR